MYVYPFSLKLAAHLFLPTSTIFFLTASLFAFSWMMYVFFSHHFVTLVFFKKRQKRQLSLKVFSQFFFVKTYLYPSLLIAVYFKFNILRYQSSMIDWFTRLLKASPFIPYSPIRFLRPVSHLFHAFFFCHMDLTNGQLNLQLISLRTFVICFSM